MGFILFLFHIIYNMNYRKVNNLLDAINIQDLKRYVRSLYEYPDEEYWQFTYPREIESMRDKLAFHNKYKEFELDEEYYLIYMDHKVIPNTSINRVLKEEYYSDEQSFRGQTLFYKLIRSKYLNISRDDVIRFLRDQQLYQVTRSKQPIKVQTKRYNHENSAWFMDLIDMTHYPTMPNRGYKYIMTVLDAFTRKSYIIGIKNKTPENVTVGMQTILKDDFKPKIIISDQGNEFKGIFDVFLRRYNVKHITTASYTPQPDIENLNKQVRSLLSHLFVKYDNTIWYNKLDVIQNNINNYNALREPLRANNNNIKYKIYAIGDMVRISMDVFNSNVRKLYKAGLQKHVHIKYSVEKLKIEKVIKSNFAHGLPMYYLSLNGHIIINNDRVKPYHFKHNDLQKIERSVNNTIQIRNYINTTI